MHVYPTKFKIVSLALLVAGCASAGVHEYYEETMRNAHVDLPLANALYALYPNTKEFISYFTGEYGRPKWNSEVGIYQRYTLTMQFPLTISQSRTHSSQAGEAQFHLAEVDSVEKMPDGRFQVVYGETHKIFGLSEWKKLQESEGDLSALGIEVIKDKPVTYFEKALVGK